MTPTYLIDAAMRAEHVAPLMTSFDLGFGTRREFMTLLMGAAATLTTGTSVEATEVHGAGASFPYPVYALWADRYNKKKGVGINYSSIGSNGGIGRIKRRMVVFAATDIPLEPRELRNSGLVQFPMVIGGVVAVVNIANVKPGELLLDGRALAGIFLGYVRFWNDPAIVALNPNIKLPSQPIVVVHRSDGSGTTFLFTQYLSKVSADWKSKVGEGSAVQWPNGIGGKGNEGVANVVQQTKGAIGYVEHTYAKQNKMSFVRMINRDGHDVAPSVQAFEAAAANADWDGAPAFGVTLSNEAGAAAWPITGVTFILMHERPHNPAVARHALEFFEWAFAKGHKTARELDYVPVPTRISGRVQLMWREKILGADGRPIWQPSSVYKATKASK